MIDEDGIFDSMYPPEVLADFGRGAMPPVVLELPIGALLILLRNLSPGEGSPTACAYDCSA